MPAAAVIPAPIAYIKVVAVKTLVVGFWGARAGLPRGGTGVCLLPSGPCACPLVGVRVGQDVYCEKIRVFKAGVCLNTLAWNNEIGLWSCFVGFLGRGND